MAGGQVETPAELIPESGFVIEFPDVSSAQAGLYAEELETDLKNAIEDAGAGGTIERVRINPEALDLGTVLAVILGAKATVEIAKGIAKWLYRNNQTTIRIKAKDGREYMITNLESGDVESIIRALNPAE